MKKLGWIGAVAGVLLLAGCSAPTGEIVTTTIPSAEHPSSEAEASAPLVAEAPAAPEADDAAYLEYVRENLLPETQIPNATDEQLLAAGNDACTRIAGGEDAAGMVVVEGEQPWENGYYYDSIAIIGGATQFICPA